MPGRKRGVKYAKPRPSGKSRADKAGTRHARDQHTPIRQRDVIRPHDPGRLLALPREGPGTFTGWIYRPWWNNQPDLHDYTTTEGRSGWGRRIAERNLRAAEQQWGLSPEDAPVGFYGQEAKTVLAFLVSAAGGESFDAAWREIRDGTGLRNPHRGVGQLLQTGALVRLRRGRYRFMPGVGVIDPASCRIEVAPPQKGGVVSKPTTTRELFDAYRAAGFTLEPGGHNMKVYDQDHNMVTVLSNTPSDHRAIANGRATLARLLRNPAHTPPAPAAAPARVFPGTKTGQLPTSAWETWNEMRQSAEYSGRFYAREGIPGWARPGGMSNAIRKLWPQLEDGAFRAAQQVIGEYLKLTGNIALLASGSPIEKIDPVWWVRDQYAKGPSSIDRARRAAREQKQPPKKSDAVPAGKPKPAPTGKRSGDRYSHYMLDTVMAAIISVTGGKEAQFTTGDIVKALPSVHETAISAILGSLDRSQKRPVTKVSKGRYLHTPVITVKPAREPEKPVVQPPREPERPAMPPSRPRRGNLRHEILAYFEEHPGELLTAAKLAADLDASQGSISKIMPQLALIPETFIVPVPGLSGAYVRRPASDDRIDVRPRQPEPAEPAAPEPEPAAPKPAAPVSTASLYEEVYRDGDFVIIKDDAGNRYRLGEQIG